MCGIAGQFLPQKSFKDTSALQAALDQSSHRGPDGQGIETYTVPSGTVLLGHRRLSIIDLSDAGLQPMNSGDERYTITFNGEIYNYVELREQLRERGHSFRTKTDTEVLLTAWQAWGVDCLDKLDGMFAFVVFDRATNSLTCARDPFGIKPFYYTTAGNSFSFASELPALLCLCSSPVAVNAQRAYDYLCWGDHDDSAGTFYEGLKQLKPGHVMHISLEAPVVPEIQRWWHPDISEQSTLSFEDASERLRELFLSSVKRQLRSDVPLGAALSGGVDSSAIVCAMRHLEPDMPIHTFSYVARGSKLSEQKWCEQVISHTRATAYWTGDPPGQMSADLDDIIRTQGEPFGSTSIAAQYQIFQLARENGITVTLDGQGADEMLAGYDGYPSALFKSYLEDHQYIKLFQFITKWRRWPGRSWKKTLLHLGDAAVPERARAIALGLAGHDLTPDWLMLDAFTQRSGTPRPPVSLPQERDAKGRRLSERLRLALSESGLPRLLRFSDRNSMRWSVESRVPFLSPELVKFTLGLPEHYLVSPEGQTKHIFRHAMRGIVPDSILDRRDKIGFETPERDILNARRVQIDTWLEAASEIDFINPDALRETVHGVLEGKTPFSFKAWRMINYCRWASLQPDHVLTATTTQGKHP